MRPAASLLPLLALTVSCVGPTLDVGELEVRSEADAGELDATLLDGAREAGPVRRDASYSDREGFPDERRFCREERDCVFNQVRDHCNISFGVCVQCYDDRQCASSRCAESEGVCKGKDESGPSSPSP